MAWLIVVKYRRVVIIDFVKGIGKLLCFFMLFPLCYMHSFGNLLWNKIYFIIDLIIKYFSIKSINIHMLSLCNIYVHSYVPPHISTGPKNHKKMDMSINLMEVIISMMYGIVKLINTYQIAELTAYQ